MQDSSQSRFLARSHLHQKVLAQGTVTPAAAQTEREGRTKLQEEDAAFAGKRCGREEEEEGQELT